jgi:hypothetical protein
MKKYKFFVLLTSRVNIDTDTKQLQDNGWELSGNIAINGNKADCTDLAIQIPFKKEIIEKNHE